jgi:MFS family permease
LDPFIRRFGDCDAKTGKCALNTNWLSMFNCKSLLTRGQRRFITVLALIYVGFATGILIGTWTQARWGRKFTVFAMSCIPFVSTTIMITSKERWQLLAGRVIHYLYAVGDIYEITNSRINPGRQALIVCRGWSWAVCPYIRLSWFLNKLEALLLGHIRCHM